MDATTEFPGGDDFGIFAIGGNNVSISGGTVKATATGKYANAIYASEGTLSISNGAEVYAKAESASAYPALYGTNGVTISNSTIDAESSGDAGTFFTRGCHYYKWFRCKSLWALACNPRK